MCQYPLRPLLDTHLHPRSGHWWEPRPDSIWHRKLFQPHSAACLADKSVRLAAPARSRVCCSESCTKFVRQETMFTKPHLKCPARDGSLLLQHIFIRIHSCSQKPRHTIIEVQMTAYDPGILISILGKSTFGKSTWGISTCGRSTPRIASSVGPL